MTRELYGTIIPIDRADYSRSCQEISRTKIHPEPPEKEVVTLAGVLITNSKSQAVTDTKLEKLTQEVRAHNHFAQRVPVPEEKCKAADHRIQDLEHTTERLRTQLE